MTTQPNAQVRFRCAIERRALWLAEGAARELPNLPLKDALQLGRDKPCESRGIGFGRRIASLETPNIQCSECRRTVDEFTAIKER